MSSTIGVTELRLPWKSESGRVYGQRSDLDALAAELHVVRRREAALVRERDELAQRQVMLAQEFEHRMVNSLQMIASLLSMQSRTATTPEAVAQLSSAARRVVALGRVHRQLHLLDHQASVEMTSYLRHLCDDLSDLLFQDRAGRTIVVEGTNVVLPTATAIPLAFVVNELTTNSVKYAQGNIVVRLETTPDPGHLLSVTDDGPGLPARFEPASSKGLGMKIVLALVKQIGGEFTVSAGDNGRGARFSIALSSDARRSMQPNLCRRVVVWAIQPQGVHFMTSQHGNNQQKPGQIPTPSQQPAKVAQPGDQNPAQKSGEPAQQPKQQPDKNAKSNR
jgi:two-component system, sensor histidine kinase PdtaS